MWATKNKAFGVFMNFWASLIELTSLKMTEPTSYGWFHLMFVAITVVVSVLMCVFFRNASERGTRIICFVLWLIIALFEVYKQLNFTFSVEDGVILSDYQWYAFPFQLCSTPLYVLPFVAFLPDGKLRDAATSYIIAFSIFGGLCVYVFPGDVFIETIGINVQTMVHHGIQIIAGVFLAAKYRDKLKIGYYLKGGIVFAVMTVIAMVMNIAVQKAIYAAGLDDTFNMFYISPYHDCTLPVLSVIYPLVPYPVFLAIYVVGFIAAAAIIFYAAKGVVALCGSISKRLVNNEA